MDLASGLCHRLVPTTFVLHPCPLQCLHPLPLQHQLDPCGPLPLVDLCLSRADMLCTRSPNPLALTLSRCRRGGVRVCAVALDGTEWHELVAWLDGMGWHLLFVEPILLGLQHLDDQLNRRGNQCGNQLTFV